jgi:hypothetical protein
MMRRYFGSILRLSALLWLCFLGSAIDQAAVSNILNATLPTATGGKPASFTAYSTAGAMFMRWNSTLSTASASGTQIPNGGGYTTNGFALGQSTASSSGSAVTLPASLISATNSSGSPWTVESIDITDNALTRTWFGAVTGQPISVAIGNALAFAANAITVSLT